MRLLAYLYRHQIPCPEVAVWEDLLRENGRAEGPMVGRDAVGEGSGDAYGNDGSGYGDGESLDDEDRRAEGWGQGYGDSYGNIGNGEGDGRQDGDGDGFGDGWFFRDQSDDVGLFRCVY